MDNFTYKSIPGWFDFGHIYQYAIDNANTGAQFVEIGAWLGRSTCFMGEQIKASGKDIRFYVVDTFRGSPDVQEHMDVINQYGKDGSIYELFNNSMKKGNVRDTMVVLQMDSCQAAECFADETLDFIFIDGDHSYDAVKKDIYSWWPKLKSRGCMAGDDYKCGWPGVDQVVDEIFKTEVKQIYTSWLTVKA